jgi:uncharacterized membrane protein YgdD (TMEM256/DUF423 family)
MQHFFLKVAAILGALSVAIGAFAAHQLKAILSADVLQIFETAVKYQFYHVFALMAVGILYKQFGGKRLLWSGYLFITGILLFSGSLYLLCIAKHFHPADKSLLGAITPLGGASFIIAWVLLATGCNAKPSATHNAV